MRVLGTFTLINPYMQGKWLQVTIISTTLINKIAFGNFSHFDVRITGLLYRSIVIACKKCKTFFLIFSNNGESASST